MTDELVQTAKSVGNLYLVYKIVSAGIVGIVIGSVLVIIFAVSHYQHYQYQSWLSISKIEYLHTTVTTKMVRLPSSNRKSRNTAMTRQEIKYIPYISYRYHHDGQEYMNSTISNVGQEFNSEFQAQQYIDSITTVPSQAILNPEAPRESLLVFQDNRVHVLFLLVGVVALVVGTLLILFRNNPLLKMGAAVDTVEDIFY